MTKNNIFLLPFLRHSFFFCHLHNCIFLEINIGMHGLVMLLEFIRPVNWGMGNLRETPTITAVVALHTDDGSIRAGAIVSRFHCRLHAEFMEVFAVTANNPNGFKPSLSGCHSKFNPTFCKAKCNEIVI